MSAPVHLPRYIVRSKPGVSNDRSRPETIPDKIRLLKTLVVRLQHQLEALSELPAPDVEQGLDFYDEVGRFEIDLIRRALMINGGHQGKAARLLNLNASTLNAKIKHYRISLDGLAGSRRRPEQCQ